MKMECEIESGPILDCLPVTNGQLQLRGCDSSKIFSGAQFEPHILTSGLYFNIHRAVRILNGMYFCISLKGSEEDSCSVQILRSSTSQMCKHIYAFSFHCSFQCAKGKLAVLCSGGMCGFESITPRFLFLTILAEAEKRK